MMPAWTFAPKPTVETSYDALHVSEVHLRFPLDGKSGGEFWVQRLHQGEPIGPPAHVAFDPGEPDTLPPGVLDWLLTACQRRNMAPPAAQPTPNPSTPIPKPAAEPGFTTLG